MRIRIKGLLLKGEKVEPKFSTLSGLSSNIYPTGINITTSEHNQEVAVSSGININSSFTKALSGPSLDNISYDYQGLPQFLSICESF